MNALKGQEDDCIHRLLAAMDEHFDLPVRDGDAALSMPVDNVVPVPGRGTVVVGTIQKGKVTRNDPVELCGYGECVKSSVANMQVFKEDVAVAEAGQNVGVQLRGVKRDMVSKGMVMVKPGSVKMSNHFKVRIP